MRVRALTAILIFAVSTQQSYSQALRIPETTNTVCMTGRKLGVTKIQIHYSAPGVKGREGKIYGTSVVPHLPY